MRPLTFLAAALTLMLSAAAATAADLQVFTLDARRQSATVTVPAAAARLAVADLASLDILDRLGLGDRVVAMSKASRVDYLSRYFDDPKIANIGTLKELDPEKLMQARPDIIFISGRLASSMERLSKIAPVIYLGIDYGQPFLDNVAHNARVIASIYSQEERVSSLLSGLQERVEAIRAKAAGTTAVVGLTTAGNFKTLGNDGRCGMIGGSLGFDNVAAGITATHGNESSFELLVKLNPEYVFVLDRDSAISRPGAQLARDLMDNELVHTTRAWQHSHIHYLTPSVWYLAEGGITATSVMLADIEAALGLESPAYAP